MTPCSAESLACRWCVSTLANGIQLMKWLTTVTQQVKGFLYMPFTKLPYNSVSKRQGE